jgi:hypothetical protein
VTCAIAGNVCGALEVRKGRLRWSIFDTQGRLVDLLELLPAAAAAGAAKVFTTSEVLAGERNQESGAGNEKK